MYDREIKQRLSEGKAERVRALPSVNCFDRRSNIVNPTQKEAQTFGYSKDLITLSLSQALTYNNLYIIKTRGHPRKYTAFLAIEQGKPHCFLHAFT